MNEHEIHRRLRQHLNRSLQRIEPDMSERLHAARRKALSRQKVAVHGLSLAGAGRLITDHLPDRRTAVAMVLVLYAESYSAIRNFALRHGDTVDVNRDLLALGVAVLAAAPLAWRGVEDGGVSCHSGPAG